MHLPLWIRRSLAVFLLPFGLICIGVPFYMLTLPERWGIIDDTRAAFGGGVDADKLKATYVDCVRERSGSSSSSSRSTGMTEYGCVIDLSEVEPIVVPPTASPAPAQAETLDDQGSDPDAEYNYAEVREREIAAMEKWKKADAEHTRRYKEGLDAFIAQSKARNDTSNRIERQLAINKSGELPTVRILSTPGEPRRVGLFWGWGEISFRWLHWMVLSLLFFGFGAGCLAPTWLMFIRKAGQASPTQ